MISIIIPTLNEEKTIEKCLSQFNDQSPPFQIIVVDGGSTDRTKSIVKIFTNTILIQSEKGRGRQMNAGAEAASGEILLFLHADTILPPNGLELIRKIMKNKEAVGGFFNLQHDESNFVYRRLSLFINFRSSFNSIPYGDQAIFCVRDAFNKLGGYKDIPLMEDYDFAKRLQKLGKLVRIREKVTTSFRRFKKGALRYTLTCNFITFLYHMGVSPYLLKRLVKEIR